MDVVLPAGGTLAEMLEIAQPDPRLRRHAHIFIADHKIAPCYWRSVRPKHGQTVTIRVVPTGGGGGGKNPLRTVLTIAVIAAAIWVGQLEVLQFGAFNLPGVTSTLYAGQILGAVAVTMIGNLAVNAIAPPPKASNTDLARGSLSGTSATLSITGSSNQADPYGPVPRVYGRMRLYPKKAARDFTEVVGEEQFLRCLFDFGYGPLDLSELRIGAVPIEQYEGVELEVRQGFADDAPVTLYSNTIREDPYSLKLSQAGGRQIVETRDGADEITIDAAFNGLVYFDDNGGRQNHSVTLRVEWRAVGETEWRLYTEEAVTGATESAVRKTWRIITGMPGRYQVALTRVTADNTSTRVRDDCYLAAVRTIQYSYPVRKAGRCLVAMRIKATDQLNGVVDQFSAIAQARLRVWTGTEWVQQATRSHAWAFVDVLTGPANPKAVADSRLDLDAIKAWADACDALAQDGEPKWTFDAVIDYVSTVFEMLRDIAASGRAALSMRDGKFSVVRDLPQTVPVQMFTPRNSWGFKGTKTFIDLPHALRVRYIEPDQEWSQQEATVYADGQTEATATKFETLETFGCTRRAQAWREGRYHMGVAQLRPEAFEFQADVEHLACTRGDLIRVAHDVPLWGGGWGRVAALDVDELGRVVGCRLDETVSMEAGKLYVVRVRGEDGVGAALSVETQDGETAHLVFQAPAPEGHEPQVGDLAVFGEAERESALLLVKSIHPGPNFTARLVCVDAAPGVHDADTGPIPAYDPGMSLPPVHQPQAPRQPVISQIRSDETVLVRTADGRAQPRIVLTIALDAGLGAPADSIQPQYRRSGSGEAWSALAPVPAGTGQVAISPVEDGVSYDLRLRALSRLGLASDWTAVDGHTVVGRTTPPPDVGDFSAARRADGVQLSWASATPLDVVGYEIREGASWGTGSVVTTRYRGTTLFVALADAADHTFHIRAIDELGLMSQSAATVTASVVPPGDVAGFDVVPQGEYVRLSWQPLADSVEYEMRAGESWALGRRVGRSAGDHLVALWPVQQAGDEVFWCKAVSPAGLYSADAAYATTRLAPLSDRNVVLSLDMMAEGWPGAKRRVAVTADGWLAVDTVGGRGEYFERIDLGRSYRARNWIDLRTATIADDPTTWDDADFGWDWDGADRPWLVTGETDGRRVAAQIALPAALGADLIEGFPLAGSTDGIRGTMATLGQEVDWRVARFGDGLLVVSTTHVAWAVAVPAEYSLTVTLRLGVEASVEMLSLRGAGSGLGFGWDAVAGAFYVVDSTGRRIAAALAWVPGDVVSVGISQTATSRALYVASWLTGQHVAAQAAYGPEGAATEVHVTGASVRWTWDAADYDWQAEAAATSWAAASGTDSQVVIAELALWSAALDGAAFVAGLDQQSPLGYGPFRDILPGDYDYAEAMIALRFDGTGAGDVVSVSRAVLSVDVPDQRDRGTAEVAAEGAAVAFARPFHVPPEIQVTVKSATAFAVPEADDVGEDGFRVRLRAQDGSTVAGTVSWSALGY